MTTGDIQSLSMRVQSMIEALAFFRDWIGSGIIIDEQYLDSQSVQESCGLCLKAAANNNSVLFTKP
jgi:hypothetical protein